MRSLSIQVHPERAPGIDMEKITRAFQAFVEREELVKHHVFSSGNDGGAYFNYTFGTPQAAELWAAIEKNLYHSLAFGSHLRKASMVMCSGETGWVTYSQWYHFDPAVPLDLPAL